MSRRRCITRSALLAATLFLGARLDGQTPNDEAQIKAAFVYNFLKFVEWPAGTFRHPQDTLVVAIIGDGVTAEATDHFLASKQIGERPLAIRLLKWDDSLAGVHAVFVASVDGKRLRRILDGAAAEKVLSIGEGEEFAEHGGVIALLIEQRRVRFDIDTDVAQAAGLRISSKLLALTRVVHSAMNGTGAHP